MRKTFSEQRLKSRKNGNTSKGNARETSITTCLLEISVQSENKGLQNASIYFHIQKLEERQSGNLSQDIVQIVTQGRNLL